MTWITQPIFFVDFEGSRASGILEYGVVTVLEGGLREPRTRLCAATGRIAATDAEIHGLRAEALAAARPFADEWEHFADLRRRGPLAAHYASAENSLLKSVWPYPRSSPHFARPGESLVDWGPWIDTARIYAQLYPQLDSGQLQSIVRARGLQEELDALAAEHCPPGRRHYHAALYDALGGALLLIALAREPALRALTLRQLLALSTLDGGQRDALQQDLLF